MKKEIETLFKERAKLEKSREELKIKLYEIKKRISSVTGEIKVIYAEDSSILYFDPEIDNMVEFEYVKFRVTGKTKNDKLIPLFNKVTKILLRKQYMELKIKQLDIKIENAIDEMVIRGIVREYVDLLYRRFK